jgi:hypothetical protein
MEEIDANLMGKTPFFFLFHRNDHRNVIVNHLIISFVFGRWGGIFLKIHAYLIMRLSLISTKFVIQVGDLLSSVKK